MRAFTFAPLATSRFANSRLDIVAGSLGAWIVVADAGLAHVHEHVQRRVPEQIGVRVGAGIEQL